METFLVFGDEGGPSFESPTLGIGKRLTACVERESIML
jgi:hypothetical protein